MSYGKNDQNLGRLGTYGATSSQQMGNATRRQSGPRRGSPPWANNYIPSEDAPDHIRLIPGDYKGLRIDKQGQVFEESVNWFEFVEHYHGGKKKGITCSGGIFRMSDRKKSDPCRGCDIWREDADTRRRIENETGTKPAEPDRMSNSSKYAYNVLQMGWFFKGYRFDEHGRIKVGNNNQPFMDWIKYTDKNYGIYQATQQDLASHNKQVEVQQGLIQSWPVNYTQFNTLISFAAMVEKHCRNCGGMNCLHTQTWLCPHCQCPTFTGNESTMPADKIKEVVNGIVTCRACRQDGYPKPILQCQNCSNPSQASIFDVDLYMQRIKVNKTNQLHLAGTSAPKPIDGVYGELLKKLVDLPRKFAPTPYDEQVQLFGPAGTAESGPAAQHFQGPPQQHFGQPAPQPNFQQYQAPAFGSYGQAPAPQGFQQPVYTPQQPPQPQWGAQAPAPQWNGAPIPPAWPGNGQGQ